MYHPIRYKTGNTDHISPPADWCADQPVSGGVPLVSLDMVGTWLL